MIQFSRRTVLYVVSLDLSGNSMNCDKCNNQGEINTYDPAKKRFVPILCDQCFGTSKKKPAEKKPWPGTKRKKP